MNTPSITEMTAGIGEIVVSDNPNAVLTVHGLGSCVAVIAYSAANRVGGLAHVQLPKLKHTTPESRKRPYASADAAIPELARQLQKWVPRDTAFTCCLVGGARVVDLEERDLWEIGRHNQSACTQGVCQMGWPIVAKDLGGRHWRTVKLFVDEGEIELRRGDQRHPRWLSLTEKRPGSPAKCRRSPQRFNSLEGLGQAMAQIYESTPPPPQTVFPQAALPPTNEIEKLGPTMESMLKALERRREQHAQS